MKGSIGALIFCLFWGGVIYTLGEQHREPLIMLVGVIVAIIGIILGFTDLGAGGSGGGGTHISGTFYPD
jgi:hypothetical protein